MCNLGRSNRNTFRRVAPLLVATSIALSAQASVAGDGVRFGVMPSLGNFKVSDPDGNTNSVGVAQPYDLVVIQEFGRDHRLFIEGFYQQFSLDGDQANIGQDVSRTGANISLQTQWRLARHIKPWIGLGLGAAQEQYTSRYITDSAGFLLTTYPDRQQSMGSWVANATLDWPVSAEWDMGVHMQYASPFGDGVKVLSLAVFFVY